MYKNFGYILYFINNVFKDIPVITMIECGNRFKRNRAPIYRLFINKAGSKSPRL